MSKKKDQKLFFFNFTKVRIFILEVQILLMACVVCQKNVMDKAKLTCKDGKDNGCQPNAKLQVKIKS